MVREYGLLHDCIIEIARDASVQIGLPEQQVIARWINSGSRTRSPSTSSSRDSERDRQTSEHLGFIAHELRNPLSAARAAVQRLRNNERAAGRAAELLERSLRRASDMIDNALSHASMKLGVDPKMERWRSADLLRDIEVDAGIDAQAQRHRAGHRVGGRRRGHPPIRGCCDPRSSTWFRTRSSSAPPGRR